MKLAICCFGSLLLGLTFTVSILDAQVTEATKFSFAPRRPSWTLLDLSGQFERTAIGLTPSGDFLAFTPSRNGTWELYRVTDWETQKPIVSQLSLPGYFSGHDQHDLEQLEPIVYATPDDKFAICVGTAEWLKRVHGRAVGGARTQSIITVVDLSTFRVVRSAQMITSSPFQFQSVRMDRSGRILITEHGDFKKGIGRLIQLDVPSLRSGPTCDFSDTNQKSPMPVTIDTCRAALGTVSLRDYLGISLSAPVRRGFTCIDKSLDYCPEPFRFSSDGEFGLGIYSEGHDNFFGSWDQTEYRAVLFSTRTHSEIGEVDLEHGSQNSEFADVRGRNYFLVLRRGSELTVYELSEPRTG